MNFYSICGIPIIADTKEDAVECLKMYLSGHYSTEELDINNVKIPLIVVRKVEEEVS